MFTTNKRQAHVKFKVLIKIPKIAAGTYKGDITEMCITHFTRFYENCFPLSKKQSGRRMANVQEMYALCAYKTRGGLNIRQALQKKFTILRENTILE